MDNIILKKSRTSRPLSAVTCFEISTLLGLDPHVLTKWTRTGKVKSWKKGSIIYVDPVEVRAYNANVSSIKTIDKSIDIKLSTTDISNIDSNTSMEKLKMIEEQCFNDYLEARKSGKIEAVRATVKLVSEINSSITEAAKRESYIRDIKEEWWLVCSDTLRKWSEPICSLINQMPKSLAPSCNPTDPTIAEKALTDFVNKQLLKLMSKQPENK